MPKTVMLELTTCRDCPGWNSEKYYTADSWENVMEWKCMKSGGKRITLMETFDDDPGIPSFCPMLQEPMPGG